ncbi:hypothetical protein ABXJ76_13640 [Methylobacter sp. G7]|uniref:hypothetical protein n=1 Tax=Methylobacter sp. G7 TaxID=3230117 RepID=UPI003D80552F
MRNILQNDDQEALLNHKGSVGCMAMPKPPVNSILGRLSLSVGVLVLLVLVSRDWGMQAVMAASPVLDLKLSGPQQTTGRQIVQARQRFTGVNVQLVNAGAAKQDARLRLFIHQDEADHNEIQAGDIKVEVREGASWVSVPVEPIDGGVIAVIGAEGSGHKEIHRRGGFAIPAKLNKTLQLRITFGSPGIYQVVVALSPDNGNTHLAQPSFITLEAL